MSAFRNPCTLWVDESILGDVENNKLNKKQVHFLFTTPVFNEVLQQVKLYVFLPIYLFIHPCIFLCSL